jgi:hypothetical protein
LGCAPIVNNGAGKLYASGSFMKTKDIVLQVADHLPEDATVLDAINDLELFAAITEGATEALNATNSLQIRGPSWLYNSPSRLSTIRHQSRK